MLRSTGHRIATSFGFSILSYASACADEPADPASYEDAQVHAPAPVAETVPDGGIMTLDAAPRPSTLDAAIIPEPVPSEPHEDAGGPARGADAPPPPEDAGDPCTGLSCQGGDPLAPFALDCAALPANGTCQGGPREVLLVSATNGLVAMFDPEDGQFAGYFKRASDPTSDFKLATQGPDQCIWSLTEDDELGIQRWNTDGSFKDAPLELTYIPRSDGPDDLAVRSPLALAFSADRAFVSSEYGDPPRLTRWTLDGKLDGIVAEDERFTSMIVLGDGSIVVADDDRARVARIPAGGGEAIPILGELPWPSQVSYAGDGSLLVTDSNLGSPPVYRVEIESGLAQPVYPNRSSFTNRYGLAPLRNGKWLITGGEFLVSVLDPDSTNPTGQYEVVWDDLAVDTRNMRYVGRACLSEEFVASRAPKPPNNTCIDPPAGPSIFAEDFEGDGEFTGSGSERRFRELYDRNTGAVATVEQAPGGSASRALKLAGVGLVQSGDVTQIHKQGVFARLPPSQPTYASYRIYVPETVERQSLGFFVLEHEALNPGPYDEILGTHVYNGYLSALSSNASSEQQIAGQWIKVELRNIDWQARTYDLYVNCERVAEAIALPYGAGDQVDLIDLFNWTEAANEATVAWYDDILIK